MSKLTKNQRIAKLERQVRGLTVLLSSLNTWSQYADEMLTELNHALPNSSDKPKIKTLDQSVFDGQDEKWRFAAVDAKGGVFLFSEKPTFSKTCIGFWFSAGAFGCRAMGYGYDTTNWEGSLIEREVGLGVSDLARVYFANNDKPHICFVGEDNDECLSDLMVAMVIGYNEDKGFETSYNDWFPFAQLVNTQGEPLTAADVGL